MLSSKPYFGNFVSLHRLVLAGAVCGLLMSGAQAAVFYVNQGVTGGNQSGNSWANAEPELGEALETVRAANEAEEGTFTEIWVAAGVYKPTHYAGDAIQIIVSPYWQVIDVPNKEADKAFRLLDNVKIYGGFNGTETDLDQRNWLANPTILSGDVGVAGDDSDNCNHVVMGLSLEGDVVLDGFTITGGNAKKYGDQAAVRIQGYRVTTTFGGGIYLEASGWHSQPLKFANLLIRNNRAVEWGGGLFHGESIAELTNVHIWENHSDWDGGGIWSAGFADLYLINSSLAGNSSGGNGGGISMAGIYFYLTNTLVAGNYADGAGGGVMTNSLPVMTNVTIAGNKADTGGGLQVPVRETPYAFLRNSIITGNAANDATPNVAGSVEARATVLGNDWYDATGVATQPNGLAVADLFVDPMPAADAPTSMGDYRLAVGSFAIDVGDNDRFLPEQDPDLSDITTDLNGQNRIVGDGIDLGPYEFVPEDSGVDAWEIY